MLKQYRITVAVEGYRDDYVEADSPEEAEEMWLEGRDVLYGVPNAESEVGIVEVEEVGEV